MGNEDLVQGFQVVLVDRLVGFAGVLGDGAREGQIGVAPFLGDGSPFFVGLSLVLATLEMVAGEGRVRPCQLP